MCAFIRKESGLLEIALPILNVELGVPHIKVTGHDDLTLRSARTRDQRRKSSIHGIKEAILLGLLEWFVRITGGHIDRNNGERAHR